MPLAGGGSGSVTGVNIVDGSISNADIASNAAIASSKIDMAIYSVAGTTLSITTTATSKVQVFAKGTGNNAGAGWLKLNYDGVQKDIVNIHGGNSAFVVQCMTCMYTEVPGAGTKNITITE